ncbi:MAG: UDP-3-O-acyl-N-acetylglucosamine deacetylase [Parachlamydiales bacterium]
MPFSIFQRTLKQSVSIDGTGLFSGRKIRMFLHPAEADSGLVFQTQGRRLEAKIDRVKKTFRTTSLGDGQVLLSTVEHLLAALYAFGICNLFIEVEGPEVPILDGSAKEFCRLIEQTGWAELAAEREILKIEEPFYYRREKTLITALPFDGLRLSYLFHDPKLSFGTQFFTVDLDEKSFSEALAPARTFSVFEEIKPLLDQGLIKGGALESAVVIKEGRLLNPEGFRFPEELARHKLLDLIGDLSLCGALIQGQITALCSGHAANTAFVRGLLQHMRKEHASFAFNDSRN